MYIPVADSPCAVKPLVEESQTEKKKPRAGTRGRRDRDLNRRRKNSAKAAPKSTSAKGAPTFTKSAPIERNLLLERISNVKRELSEVREDDHAKIAELRQIVAGIASRYRALREQGDTSRRQVQGKRSARKTLAVAHLRDEFDRPEWAQPSHAEDGQLSDQRGLNNPTARRSESAEATTTGELSVAGNTEIQRLHEKLDALRVEVQALRQTEQPNLLDAPESRPIEQGKFCVQVIDDVRRIRNLYRSNGMSVGEIQNDSPRLAIWKVRDLLGEEDRETFNHPNRWGPPVGYAKGILSRIQNVSPHTINSWVKVYRKSRRSKKL